jgi:hypothetical protein
MEKYRTLMNIIMIISLLLLAVPALGGEMPVGADEENFAPIIEATPPITEEPPPTAESPEEAPPTAESPEETPPITEPLDEIPSDADASGGANDDAPSVPDPSGDSGDGIFPAPDAPSETEGEPPPDGEDSAPADAPMEPPGEIPTNADTPDSADDAPSPVADPSGNPGDGILPASDAPADVFAVTLPNDISFDIVIFQNTGLVASPEFQIVNHGALPVSVALREALLIIADPEGFTVQTDENLPESGNNIYVSLISGDQTVALSATPAGTDLICALAGGESASFRLAGVVNEYGDIPWSETAVSVSIRFELSEMNADEPEERDR